MYNRNMTKYQKIYQEMISKYKQEFESFKTLHDNFVSNPNAYREQFNLEGEKILEIIREHESLLTKHSDNSGYGKFSSNLSEKFWNEVKKVYPKIDFIGVH